MSVSFSHGRVSRLASSCPKDFDFEFFVYANEALYSDPWNGRIIIEWFQSLPDATYWNCMLCVVVYLGVIMVTLDLTTLLGDMEDIMYNVIYGIHCLAMFYDYQRMKLEIVTSAWVAKTAFLMDVLTYVHYPAMFAVHSVYIKIKLVCYIVRFHRPLRYLWSLTDSNLKGSVLGTALKYIYIFLMLRIICVEVCLNLDKILDPNYMERFGTPQQWPHNFFKFSYEINNNFMLIGSSLAPVNDYGRVKHLLVRMLGCLMVTGAAVASLSLVVSLYMRPEELFRSRFRLIMQDLKKTKIRQELRDKVETFYKMYWLKKKAVSVTRLLPIFPPTLVHTIHTDIYFEAQQKSVILRDLSYQFLYELARVMQTQHYIPGDAIIQLNSSKSTIIYITYGDVEMLTAEDNRTPILRMTRGTILSSCGGCVPVACGKSPVEIRAATFCIAHVLKISDLWKVAVKHGRQNGQAFIIHSSFEEHFEKVKMHYRGKQPQQVKFKSSILYLKRNLIALKEAKNESGDLLLSRDDYFLEIAGCYLMRNRANTSLTDESDLICLRPTFPCILQPQSSLLVVWHGLVAFLICIVTITHPYNLMYLPEVSYKFKFWDFMMTLVYTVDLIVHLSTGSNVEEGVPITLAQTSSQQLQNPWFVLDVLGTLPIFEFVGDGKFAGINKLLRIPKVFRVLKSMEDVCVYHSNVLRLASYSLIILTMTYLVATVQQCFMCYNGNRCLIKNFTRRPFWSKGELDTETVENRVTYGLYWSISFITFTTHWTQLVGIDSITTILYNILLLEMLAIIHLFIEAVYSATIMVTTTMRDEYDQCIENVKNFLIRNHVDPTLRLRFIQYLQLCWYTDMAYAITHEKQSIYFDLPAHVYQDILSKQRIKYIECLPFMKLLHEEELKYVSSKAKLFYTSPNEILLNTGDVNNEIYIVKKGMCEVFDPDTKEVVALISSKMYFGVLECLMRFPSYYTVRAVTYVQVISISKKHLDMVIRLPKVKEALDFIRLQPEYNRVRRRRELFLEYECPPPIPNRQVFPLPRKHIGDAVFMQPFQRLGFFSVLRYIFPRFTIRPDGRYMTRYEWFRCLCALLSAMFYPSYTYMVLQFPWLYYLTVSLDISAYYDIIQRMLVGFYNDDGILVYHPASTAANYIGGAFLVDLFSSLPMEHLEYIDWIDKNTNLLMPQAQFLMLNRLLQLYRLPGALDILSTWISRRDIILVIKSTPLVLAVMNVLTCLVVYHSASIYAVNNSTKWRIVPLNGTGGSWMLLFKRYLRFNPTESPWNMHLTVYFWVVYESTSTGYSMFLPSSLQLLRIFFFGMLVSCMITTYITVSIISIRANVNKAVANFQEHMRDIVSFMRRENLNDKLQQEVIDYYSYNWEERGGLDYRLVLKLCDQITLRTDAILHIYGHTFAKCPILFHCDMSLLRVMGRSVHSVYFQRNTRIYEKDEVISDMYFLDYGKVDVQDDNFHLRSNTQLTRGSVFGNLDAKETFRCQMQVVATTNIHVLKINSVTFHDIINDFPTVIALMNKYRPKNEPYILGNIREGSTDSMMWKEHRKPSDPLIEIYQRSGLLSYLVKQKHYSEAFLIVVCLVCIYADIYNAAFQDNSIPLIMTLYFLDVCFCMKMLITFTMPMITDEPEMKKNLLDIRKQYLRGDFKYDLASSLPIELFSFTNPDHMWRLFSLLRLNRLFRVVTVDKCLKKQLNRLESNLTLATILSVTIWFTLFIHTTSCLWYTIGMNEESNEPNSSWMSIKKKYNCYNMYFSAMYFVLCTFMQHGMSDILPKNHSEVIFVVLLEIISSLIYMIYVGEFSNIIQYQSFRSFDFYSQYLELQDYLKNNRVSASLVKLINRYSLHLWRENRGWQVPYFLSTAPQCYKLKIMSAAYLYHFLENPAFQDCEHAFLRQLVGCVTVYTYCEDIFVVKDSEITNSMYLIHKGTVQQLDEDMDEKRAQVYVAGEHFGLMQGLVRDTPFTYSYRTKTKSQVLTLHLDAWEYLLEHFPQSRYAIYKHIPGHPYSHPPRDGPPSPPNDDLPKQTLYVPVETETAQELIDDADAVEEDPWSVRRRVRRSTIFATKLPIRTDSMISDDFDEEKGRRDNAIQERKSVFHIPVMESDVMLTDMEDDENLQTIASELSLTREPSKKGTTSSSSSSISQPMQNEADHVIELSETSVTSELSEEPTFKRRKTLFQKFTDSAKKLVSSEDKEKEDTLLLEEQTAATDALLDTFEDKDEYSRKSVQKKGKTEEDEGASSSRTPRLSFHPRLLEEDEQSEATNETKAAIKTSASPETVDKEIDDVEYGANRQQKLSYFHTGTSENKDTSLPLEKKGKDETDVVQELDKKDKHVVLEQEIKGDTNANLIRDEKDTDDKAVLELDKELGRKENKDDDQNETLEKETKIDEQNETPDTKEPATSAPELGKKTEDSVGSTKKSKKPVTSLGTQAADSIKGSDKIMLPTEPLPKDDSPTPELDISLWPMHNRSQIELATEDLEDKRDDDKNKGDAKNIAIEERAVIFKEANKDNNSTQEVKSDIARDRKKPEQLTTEILEIKNEEDDDDLLNIHSDQDIEDYLSTNAKDPKPDAKPETTSALRTERMSRISRVRYEQVDDQADGAEPDDNDQPSTSRPTDPKKK